MFKALLSWSGGPRIDSRWCYWGFFPWFPLIESCAQRATHPLKVSTRDFSWGKGGRCLWLTTYQPCSAETSSKSGVLNYPAPLGPPQRENFTLLYINRWTFQCLVSIHNHYKTIKEKCLQRGTDWNFKYSGLRFVFKGLKKSV